MTCLSSEASEDVARSGLDFFVGEADDRVARRAQCRVLERVFLARSRAAVAGTVDLDGELQIRPVKVHLEAVKLGVHSRLAELGRLHQGEKHVLAAASRTGAAARVELESSLEYVEVVTAVRSRHRVADGGLHEAAVEGCFVDDVRELVSRHDVREVDERAVDGRDGDHAAAGDLTPIEPIAAMDLDAFQTTPPRGDDGNQRGTVTRDLVKLRRGHVAYRRAIAGREHRGETSALPRERDMPDRIDACMNTNEPPARDSPRDPGV
jgi:hypothetical protein